MKHVWDGRLDQHVPVCSCGKKGEFNVECDAYLCPDSQAWLEPVCGDLKCPFCTKRPEKPEP